MEGMLVGPDSPTGTRFNTDTSFPLVPVLVVVIGAFMAVLDASIVNVVLPKLMAVFGTSQNNIQWVVTGYMLSSGMVVPPTGFLADRVGMKKMYVFALAVFTTGSLLCGLAWKDNILIAFRVLQAVGGGMILPLSMSIIYALVPRQKVGLAMGILGIGAIGGPAIGPTLGGWLTVRFSWRLIFTINIPVGILAIILVLLVLPKFPRRPDLPADLPGVALAAYGAFACLLALSQGQEKGWTSLYIVVLLVTGGFAFLLFALRELGHRAPVIDVRLFRNAVLTISLVATGLATCGLYATLFMVPMFV